MLFRNILSLIAVLTAAGVPAGCSTTARLTRRQATAHLAQLSRTERQSKVRDDRPQVVRVERDSSDYYLVPVERDERGEALGTVPIEEVVVVARVRSIPERRGRVTLDFNVELPKELLGRSRSVVITPFLHRQDEQIPLDDIIIRGALFDRVQQRDYWQYTTYLGRFRPDSVRAERAFQRFVKYPYAQDARLDSLIENRTSISYYYSQEVPTEETSRKMLITLRGRVEGLDDSTYTLPPSDTLTYTVSSLLSFLDTLPRYRIRVIDKYVTVNDRYSLSFLTGDARLVDTLGDNARELARIAALMERIVTQQEFHVDSIVLTASASPEGRRALNERLSRARAEALRSYLAGCFGRRADRLLTIRSAGELWPELTARIAREDLRCCRAVETERGTVLFTQEPDGREACERYMQHHADCFFDPDLGVETLRVYEVEADPDGFWDKVNPQVLPTAGGMMWVPEHPFVDAEVLRRGYCLKEYDMRATADNFWAFVNPQHGENLYVSNGIRDLTGLQIIMQRGYGYLMQNAERYWNREFVFRSGFDNIERKYASDLSDEGRAAKREEQYNLAAYILDRKFPIRRRPSSEIPPMQAEGIRTFRNFDAINLLFRPDKLLEAYQRRRDEPVRGTEFHLKRH